MNEFRRDFREAQSEFYWTLPRVLCAVFVAACVIGLAGFVLNALSQPARIVSKTIDADNVINNYEWFRDAYGNYQARFAQVAQFKPLLTDEKDQAERNRLRIELTAIQQSCRELVQRYNANANKANRSIFMGSSVPPALDGGKCE